MRSQLLALLTVSLPAAGTAQEAPVPRSDSTGPALHFTFPGMRIGVAEYEEGPTGTTVFYFPAGVKAAVDVRGGAPGSLNSDAVRLGYESREMQAVVFSGGSWYGLSAATGVANGIKALQAERGNQDFIAGVLGAIIYDVGARRYSRVTPDDRLGVAALLSAREGWFPLGARGAGRFAMQGFYFMANAKAAAGADWPHSGQGGAFREVGPTKIAVFTVVNALGMIVGRDGRVVRCRRNTTGAPCPLIADLLHQHLGTATGAPGRPPGPTANTTLTLVATNQKLPYWAMQRLAVQVHTSMARAIQPLATEDDGDILFAVTTDEVDNPSLKPMELGAVASEVAWDAILASVPDLPEPPVPATTQLSAAALRDFVGTFAFPDSGKLMVSADSGALRAVFAGNGRIYFDEGVRYRLVPAGPDRFLVEAPGQDVVRFERSSGRVTGIVLDPGPWNQRATRLK